jgi:uncharacterized phage protein (TIGR01671 family)
MIREIKFRAIHKNGGSMTDHKEVCRLMYNEACDTMSTIEAYNVMQYTGLKDKNNIEIFEGDIVIHKVGYGQNQFRDEINGEVYFKEGCYYVNSNVSDRDGYFHKKLSDVVSDFMPEKYSCEIIGNKYQ